MSERALRATSFAGPDTPSRIFAAGRTCEEPGCRTRLSMYNDGERCSLHAPMEVPRTRGKKIA